MCINANKCVECFATIALYIYSFLTLYYSVTMIFLSIAFPFAVNSKPRSMDYAFSFCGFIAGFSHYILALACMSATKRMVTITDYCARLLPLYNIIKKWEKNTRTFLLIVWLTQVSYGMALR